MKAPNTEEKTDDHTQSQGVSVFSTQLLKDPYEITEKHNNAGKQKSCVKRPEARRNRGIPRESGSFPSNMFKYFLIAVSSTIQTVMVERTTDIIIS